MTLYYRNIFNLHVFLLILHRHSFNDLAHFFCNSINKNPPKHLYLIDTLLMTDMTSPYHHDITEILLNVALSTINHHFHPVSTSCTTKAVVVVIVWIYNYLCNQCLSPLSPLYHPLFITPIKPLYHSSILYRWVV
jgi:hypothetical protein